MVVSFSPSTLRVFAGDEADRAAAAELATTRAKETV